MTLLNRCFPKKLSSYAEQLIKFVNEFDLAEKVLADMYTSWREMLYLCLISVGKWSRFVNEFDLAEKVLADMYTSWREMLYLCLISVGEWLREWNKTLIIFKLSVTLVLFVVY